jgi:hypothetical protein
MLLAPLESPFLVLLGLLAQLVHRHAEFLRGLFQRVVLLHGVACRSGTGSADPGVPAGSEAVRESAHLLHHRL